METNKKPQNLNQWEPLPLRRPPLAVRQPPLPVRQSPFGPTNYRNHESIVQPNLNQGYLPPQQRFPKVDLAILEKKRSIWQIFTIPFAKLIEKLETVNFFSGFVSCLLFVVLLSLFEDFVSLFF